MRYSTSETSMHRILGLAICMLGCALMIIGSNPHFPALNYSHTSEQTGVIVRFLIGFSFWLYGTLFAMWPDIRDVYFSSHRRTTR